MHNGTESAFEQLVDTYKAYVCAIILSIAGETEDVQDIAQEVFLQVYRSLPGFKTGNLKSWISRIAVNKTIDWKRSQVKKNTLLNTNEDVESVWILPGQDAPDKVIIRQEDRERLEKICTMLPDRYADVIQKFYFQDKGYNDIAVEEGISTKTVESRLYRARIVLRQKWEEVD
ncbi:MAG: RNA polymerase sigma factor [Bacillota bacterium]|nr:RNA polymerase sigma factor [Bacillota bacterium]